MNWSKVFGSPLKKFIEISLDLTRWLIGFGWGLGMIHFNLGPFVIIFGWRIK